MSTPLLGIDLTSGGGGGRANANDLRTAMRLDAAARAVGLEATGVVHRGKWTLHLRPPGAELGHGRKLENVTRVTVLAVTIALEAAAIAAQLRGIDVATPDPRAVAE